MSRPIIGRALTTRALIARAILARGVGSGGSPPVSFCSKLSLTSFQDSNSVCAITNDTDMSVTSGGAAGFMFCIAQTAIPETVIPPTGGKIWVEHTITSAPDGYGFGMAIDFQAGPPDPQPFAIVVMPNVVGGTAIAFTVDNFNLAPGPFPAPTGFTNFSNFSLPYTFQTLLDTTTGEVSYQDSEGNGGSLGFLSLIVGGDIALNPLAVSFDGSVVQTIDTTINLGYGNPTLAPPVGYESWCFYQEDPRTLLCGTLLELGVIFGSDPYPIDIIQGAGDNDIRYTLVNQDIQDESLFLSSSGTLDTANTPFFVEITYGGIDIIAPDTSIASVFSILIGLIGFGSAILPKRQVGTDGAIGLFPSGERILGEQFVFNSGVLSPEEFVVTYVSGPGSDLNSIGFGSDPVVFSDSVPGVLGVSDSTLTTLGLIAETDYSGTNLVFDVQLGVNPPVQITLNSATDQAPTVAFVIQSQLQAAGGAYAAATVDVLDGIDIQAGYNIVFGWDMPNFNLFYEDNLGNTGLIDLDNTQFFAFKPFLQLLSFPYGLATQQGPSSTLIVSQNSGKYVPYILPPVEYKGWCTVGPGNRLYLYQPLISFGQNFLLENGGRTVNLTNDLAYPNPETPNGVFVFGDFAFSITEFSTNCFESRIDFVDPGVIKEEFSCGLNALINSDMRLSRVGYSGNNLEMRAEYPFANPITLSNQLPDYAVGDVMTACVFNNGYPNSGDTAQVQFVIKVGADLVIYDKVKMFPVQNSTPPYTAFIQLNEIAFPTNDNNPDGNKALITFNGVDGDYTVTDYPPDFLDNNGQPMPASIDLGYQRNAVFTPFYVQNGAGTVAFQDADKTVQFDAVDAFSQVKTHLPLFASPNVKTVIGMRIVTANGNFKLEGNGIQVEQNAKVYIEQVAGDLVLSSYYSGVQNIQVIRPAYTLQAGDEIYLQLEPGPGIPGPGEEIGTVTAFLWDGVTLDSATDDYVSGLDIVSYMVLMQADNVPALTQAKYTSLCKAADMDTINVPFVAGAVDVEGNPV